MRYIWDNYIEWVQCTSVDQAHDRLSEAENIVLIGHGSGCSAIMDLINSRGGSIKNKANARCGPQGQGCGPSRRHALFGTNR